MKIRTQLKAGAIIRNHNEALQVRSTLRAGKVAFNHNEALLVRSALKAGKLAANHNQALQVRSTLRAGIVRIALNHSETLRLVPVRSPISMRKQIATIAPRGDRVELLAVRAGLRAGARNERTPRAF